VRTLTQPEPPVDVDLVPRVVNGASTTVVEGTTVVYDERGQALLMLNASAGSVWASCDGVRTLEDIATALAAAHGAPRAAVLEDVCSTVCVLVDAGLLADARATG